MNPKAKGERSEACVLAALLKAGEVVLTPFGDNQRYDLVIDRNGEFLRIQCKTGRLKGNSIEFNTCSTAGGELKYRRGYQGQIEYFGVYCPETDRTYLVPVDAVGKRSGTLTLHKIQRNQRAASDYELKDGV